LARWEVDRDLRKSKDGDGRWLSTNEVELEAAVVLYILLALFIMSATGSIFPVRGQDSLFHLRKNSTSCYSTEEEEDLQQTPWPPNSWSPPPCWSTIMSFFILIHGGSFI
jgi:hypothetical protein